MTEKEDMWIEKYKVDVEAKQKEIDVLKLNKTKNLTKLNILIKLVHIL